MELVSALLLLLALWLAWLLLRASVFGAGERDRVRLPPGPRGLPLLGSLLSLDAAAPHESLLALARRYGRDGACSLRLGGVRCVVLTDPALVRRALDLDACTGRAPLFLTHGIMHGKGLICAEGELWRAQRRFVAGSLRALGMVRVGARRRPLELRIACAAQRLVDILRAASEAAGDAGVEASGALLHCVGSVVSAVVFGHEWAEDDPTWRWLLHTQEEGTKLIGVAGAINFLPFLRFLPHYRRIIAYIKGGQAESHALYARLAEAAAAEMEAQEVAKGQQEDESPESGDGEGEGDGDGDGEDGGGFVSSAEHVLGAFVAEQRRRRRSAEASGASEEDALGHFTDEQRHYLLADLFGAGLDTTIVSLRWFLLFMALHPDEQEAVWQELRSVGCAERPPALDDAPALPRLRAALAEAQRLRPAVPLGIPHGVTKEVSVGEWRLPAGTMLLPLLWALHTDEKHFPQPHSYQPQRFLAADGRFQRPPAFMPFQAGKRACVGETLAEMLLLLVAGALLQAFRVALPPRAPPPDLRGQSGITLAPHPHRLLFAPRRP